MKERFENLHLLPVNKFFHFAYRGITMYITQKSSVGRVLDVISTLQAKEILLGKFDVVRTYA